MYRHTSLLSLLLLFAGCLPPHPTPAQREAYAQERLIRSVAEQDEEMAKEVMEARDACAASPADPRRAHAFGREQNNGLASASISSSTSEVEIASSCTGVSAR